MLRMRRGSHTLLGSAAAPAVGKTALRSEEGNGSGKYNGCTSLRW